MLMKKYLNLLVISWLCVSPSLAIAGDVAPVKIDLKKKIAVLHATELEKAKKVDACVTAGHAFAYCASQVMSGYICTKQNSSSGQNGSSGQSSNSGTGGAANNGSQNAFEACMAAGGTMADCVASSGLSGVGG